MAKKFTKTHTKQSAKPSKAVAKVTKTATPPELDLTKHTVTDLLLWRDTASKRVDKARARMVELEKEFEELNKKSHKDIKWIRRLHNELSRKVFGHRPRGEHTPAESPIQAKIAHHIEELTKLTVLQEAIQ